MIVDIHVHEMNGSSDSKLNIEDAIKIAEQNGIDGICITDHDSLYWRNRIEKYQKNTDVLLIVGVEIYTLDGDILCFGINEIPENRISAKDTIDYVHERGGVCIAAHPYRNNKRGLGDKIFELKELDAVEAFNGRTKLVNNCKCYNLSLEKRLNLCGGSDSHTSEEVGNTVTKFENSFSTEYEFIEAIKIGNYYPISNREFLKKIL